MCDRDTGFIATDIRVVRWIAQAAVNVELFTIPLYMTTLYSITGMHPITGQGNAFYKGRLWPGAKTSYFVDTPRDQPGWGNREAYNIIFSVFIQEMLHLQMAANIATAIGAVPDFTDPALQDKENGWTCYGKDLTVIPDIVDLRDTRTFKKVKVNVGPLDEDRIELFLAIELPQEEAEADIDPEVKKTGKYFPPVPFDKGDPDYEPATAGIMFGSIGYMYQCYRDYLQIQYNDGSCLWDHVFNPSGQQNDLFNNFSFPGHPMREFMGFETTIALTDSAIAFKQALNMMNAITDQGEGATLKARLKVANAGLLKKSVETQYRSDNDALKSDYPSFSDTGAQEPSADAKARYVNDGEDHYGRFIWVRKLMREGGIETWDQSPKVGKWTAADLTTVDFDPADPLGLPAPQAIATALNNLNSPPGVPDPKAVRDANFAKLSQAVVGAIKGVTTVLNQYWAGTGSFPFPSMVGSGDRMSACWAAFGQTPDLSMGIPGPDTNVVNHACQGLSLTPDRGSVGNNSCALTPIFHSCRGSNLCKGMGGCGFVQASTGGGSCGGASSGCGAAVAASTPAQAVAAVTLTPGVPKGGGCSAVKLRMLGGLCGGPTPTPSPTPPPSITYTAPSDNICGGFGGCAVPISACQVYPKAGTMDVYLLGTKSSCGTPTPTPNPHGCGSDAGVPGVKTKNLCPSPTPTPSSCSTPTNKKIGTLQFNIGDKVEDIAFAAFKMVAAEMGAPEPVQQPPNDLRLAFPPST
ncbi:MAG: ferritin-like domain-containing protein [Pseudomonadota bacterium]